MVALTITVNGENPKNPQKMHERVIKNFLDTIILDELQRTYKRIRHHILHTHHTHQIRLPRQLRHRLLAGTKRLSPRHMIERKRVYKLTERGAKTIETILTHTTKSKAS